MTLREGMNELNLTCIKTATLDDTIVQAAAAGFTWSREDVYHHLRHFLFDIPVPPEFKPRFDEMNRELRSVGPRQ